MNREPRSTVIETENKKTVVFDEQTERDLQTIKLKVTEIFKMSLTAENVAERFVDCFLDEFFCVSDDISELEDRIEELAELLTEFVERLKGGADNE